MKKLWLTPAQAAPLLGYANLQSLYRDIRCNQFPWRFEKVGKRIKISARSIGAIGNHAEEKAQVQEEVSHATT